MNRRMFAIHGGLAGAALLLSPAATAGDERVGLALSEGGSSVILTTAHENVKFGTQ
jgi:hypothetical protein